MANSTSDSARSASPAWGPILGWIALSLGLFGLILYGVSLETGGSLADPLNRASDIDPDTDASTESAPDPRIFHQALNDALDQAWQLLVGPGSSGVRFADLTDDPDRLERAGHLIDGVLASRPADDRAFVLEGLRQLALGDEDAAREAIERSLEVGGGEQSLLVLGTFHAHVGDLDSAEDVFRRATEEYPASLSAWSNYAQVLSQRGEPERAEEAYARVEELRNE